MYGVTTLIIYPQLSKLYENLNMTKPTTNTYFSFIALSLLSIIEIIAAVILFKKTKEPATSYKKLLLAIVGVIILGFFFGAFAIMYSFIIPIYNITSSIK